MWATGKYSSRFVLGLKAIEFAMEDIYFIDDRWIFLCYRPPARGKGKAADGINHKALITIVRLFNYDSLPAGVQGCIDGSKCF